MKTTQKLLLILVTLFCLAPDSNVVHTHVQTKSAHSMGRYIEHELGSLFRIRVDVDRTILVLSHHDPNPSDERLETIGESIARFEMLKRRILNDVVNKKISIRARAIHNRDTHLITIIVDIVPIKKKVINTI